MVLACRAKVGLPCGQIGTHSGLQVKDTALVFGASIQMENVSIDWDLIEQQSCSDESFPLDSENNSMSVDYMNENARMSFYDEEVGDSMEASSEHSDSQLLDEDSGLGSMSRGKTVSLTTMFSQFRTASTQNTNDFAAILEVSTENLAIDLSDHEKETISSLDLLEKKVETKSPRRFGLKDITNTTPRKTPPRRLRKIDRKRSCVQLNSAAPYPSFAQTQARKRRNDFLLEKRISPQGIPIDARPIRRIQSTSLLETSVNSEASFSENFDVNYSLRTVEKPQIEDTAFHSISGQTLSVLLQSMTKEQFLEKFILIDCRYPFEYDGGHIKYARNVYERERIQSIFYPNDSSEFLKIKKKLPIFYCEFSQKRGPKMARELRNCDRQRNANCYPHLDYPEVYVLDYGYQSFFVKNGLHEFCEPQHYIPMLHREFTSQLSRYNQHKKQR